MVTLGQRFNVVDGLLSPDDPAATDECVHRSDSICEWLRR